MRRNIQLLGLVLAAQGISGAVNRVAVQPFLGIVLNFFDRVVIPRLGFLTGYELYANLVLAAFGLLLLLIAASRRR
ncbi:hypothetical protein [Sphaerisporangium dianthi]|uniref:Uncharacterized protein n=1 Tax=Sphaerisporangium dianthi TaxID=1436120 RepID=A0ABV9CM77_9ACTN